MKPRGRFILYYGILAGALPIAVLGLLLVGLVAGRWPAPETLALIFLVHVPVFGTLLGWSLWHQQPPE